jgi:hypothetical protein
VEPPIAKLDGRTQLMLLGVITPASSAASATIIL